MDSLLHNPVFHALLSGDKHLSLGNERVKYFEEDVSPFAGFPHNYTNGFDELYELLPTSRKVLYANPSPVSIPKGWQLQHEIKGVQFIYNSDKRHIEDFNILVPLTKKDIPQMVELARLTKPGPFLNRTIEFGHYYGVFDGDQLVAMTGQRLHVEDFTEISAVCTHPDYLGKGYATLLLQHQLQLILSQGQHPFLHVREDNERAIAVYKRLGFTISTPMIFYFLKRE